MNKTKDSGHGGMDGIMMYRIVECLQNGTPLDQNLYEGCAWSALIELNLKFCTIMMVNPNNFLILLEEIGLQLKLLILSLNDK